MALILTFITTLRFSSRIKFFFDNFISAMPDLVFFFLIYLSLFSAFTIIASQIFGPEVDIFADFNLSLISNLYLIVGTIQKEFYFFDLTLKTVYYLLFLIIFNLILINMFLAIQAAHYKQNMNVYKGCEPAMDMLRFHIS
jgi:hypothetical protein